MVGAIVLVIFAEMALNLVKRKKNWLKKKKGAGSYLGYFLI